MNATEIIEEIKKAQESSKTLLLEKYVNSDGVVKDYVVRLLPGEGYHDLVKQSLDILDSNTQKFMSDIKPEDADMAEWATAISDQIDSFKKSLNPDKEKKAFTYKNPTVSNDGMHFYEEEFKSGNVNTVIIKNVEVLSTTLHSENVEEKLPKGNIARYKHIIKSHLPITRYVGQFNLSADKVQCVKAVLV
jgi:hypothetical protein